MALLAPEVSGRTKPRGREDLLLVRAGRIQCLETVITEPPAWR